MQLLVFVLVYPIIWLISVLPHRIFYTISDISFVLIYHIIGYRKKVVHENLSLVFPHKTSEEIKDIEKKFYQHLCDLFLEMVKSLNLTEEQIKKKYHITNVEVVLAIEKDKSILVPCAHYGNWEWNPSLNLYVKSKGYAVYQTINNKYFNRLFLKIRSRWGTELITQQETVKTVMRNEKNGVKGVYGIISDQSPQVSRAHYWSEFMGVKVPIFNGVELMARKMDLAVVFMKVSKVKRGFYEAEFIPITTSGQGTEPSEITKKFIALTEAQIKERPELYLWTHKRWKHRNKKPKQFAKNRN
jgi:KDO2-lipid IV(A) lauroyltransferase